MTDKEKIVIGVLGAGALYLVTRPKKTVQLSGPTVNPTTGAVTAGGFDPLDPSTWGSLLGNNTGGSQSQAQQASGIISSIGNLFNGIGSIVRGVDQSSPTGSGAGSTTSGSTYSGGYDSGILDPGAVDLGDPGLNVSQGGFGGGSNISLGGDSDGSLANGGGGSDPLGVGGLTLGDTGFGLSDLAN